MRKSLIGGAAIAMLSIPLLASTGWTQLNIVHRDHLMSFETPVALPNGVMLPAGTYVFALHGGARHDLTQILSADRTKVFATLYTIPIQRNESSGFKVIVEKTSADTLPMITAWYCEGNRTGHRFQPVASAKNPS